MGDGFFYLLWIFMAIAGTITIIMLFTPKRSEENDLGVRRKNNRERMHDYLKDNYPHLTRFFLHYDSGKGVALDVDEKLLYFLSHNANKEVSLKKRPFSSLLESEVVEDGITVTKTARGSQLAGAAIGGVLAGGTGAVIGGLSGTKEGVEVVSSVDLKLLFNDMENPVEIIRFFSPMINKSAKKTDKDYLDAFNEITNWHGTMKVIIENN